MRSSGEWLVSRRAGPGCMMKKVAVLLALALSVGCAAAYVSSCDASAARNDCGE